MRRRGGTLMEPVQTLCDDVHKGVRAPVTTCLSRRFRLPRRLDDARRIVGQARGLFPSRRPWVAQALQQTGEIVEGRHRPDDRTQT